MTRSRTPDITRAGRVALVGRPNVGKSTLLNALVGQAIAITSPQPQTTRAAVRGITTRAGAQYLFVDTPGLHAPRSRLGERMNAAAREAAAEADAVVYLVAAATGVGGAPALSDPDVKLLTSLPPRPTLLAINKIDRLESKESLLPFLASMASAFGETRFEAMIPVSARRADGTDRLLDALAPLLPEQPMLFDPDTLSDQPARFFVAELVREQVLRKTRHEVPHGVAVIVEAFDETGPAARIEATIHVARESHKKIVIGAGGQMLKAIGSAARGRVERMLDRKVHLRLHVRATPG
ncbi:MAG: GTPase Era, partial [Polyangiaceae bacterium]|nr:GTPase Era [Polyangiaceae bacterium]